MQPTLELWTFTTSSGSIAHKMPVTFCRGGCQQANYVPTYNLTWQWDFAVQEAFPWFSPWTCWFFASPYQSRRGYASHDSGLQLMPSDVARRLKLDCAVALACRRQLCQKLSIGGILTWRHRELGNVRANGTFVWLILNYSSTCTHTTRTHRHTLLSIS